MGKTDQADLRARIDALEAHIAHQDLAFEELNAVVTKQWGKISDLVRQLEWLQSKLQEKGDVRDQVAGDLPPPHY
ncbi:MAG: SlyX family protein [Pseudomonadota bacterium]|nr:SlyX family protein [Pseudomonadota bacterium]